MKKTIETNLDVTFRAVPPRQTEYKLVRAEIRKQIEIDVIKVNNFDHIYSLENSFSKAIYSYNGQLLSRTHAFDYLTIDDVLSRKLLMGAGQSSIASSSKTYPKKEDDPSLIYPDCISNMKMVVQDDIDYIEENFAKISDRFVFIEEDGDISLFKKEKRAFLRLGLLNTKKKRISIDILTDSVETNGSIPSFIIPIDVQSLESMKSLLNTAFSDIDVHVLDQVKISTEYREDVTDILQHNLYAKFEFYVYALSQYLSNEDIFLVDPQELKTLATGADYLKSIKEGQVPEDASAKLFDLYDTCTRKKYQRFLSVDETMERFERAVVDRTIESWENRNIILPKNSF